jgi:hypothetical protein
MEYSYVIIYNGDLIVSGSNMKSIIGFLNKFCGGDAYFEKFTEHESIYNNDNLLGKIIYKEEFDLLIDTYEFDLYKVDFAKPELQELRDDNIKDILDL